MTKHFTIHIFSIVVCLALSNFLKFGNCHSGEKVDGIVKLKKYFNHLGYIPNSPSNFTNDFDDDLESAIRTYQKNFNLNVTGELDDQTLRHVERPRCGHPDIVNGITTMNSGKPISAEFNSTKLHTVAHFGYHPESPIWDHRNLTYAFNDGKLLLNSDVTYACKMAFDKWSAVSTFKFNLTQSFESADIKIGFYVNDPKIGVNFYGALAYAYGPPDGRIYINKDYAWAYYGMYSSYETVQYDLETVLLHEIGHVLGLGHSSFEKSLMYPTIKPWETKVVVDTDDIKGISYLYDPTTPPSTSSLAVLFKEEATPPDSAEETPDAAGRDRNARACWGVGALLAVGFLLILL